MRQQNSERRGTRRVDLRATATLLQQDVVVGRFTVQNLSAGGALLTGARGVPRSVPLRLVLELPDGVPLSVGARVRRRAQVGNLVALAVAFEHLTQTSEDQIQDAVLGVLDQRYRDEHPAVLVVDSDEVALGVIRAQLRALGRRSIPCRAPLDAMRMLESDEPLEAVVARDGVGSNPELLAWVADTYPGVRSILLVEDRCSDPSVAHLEIARCFPEHLGQVLA